MDSDVERLKLLGNKAYQEGNTTVAIQHYREAIAHASCSSSSLCSGTSSSSLGDKRNGILAVLFSNLSLALFTCGSFDDSVKAAEEATVCDPTMIKAWIRLARAQLSNGRTFAAFVTLHHRIAELTTKTNAKEVSELLGSLPDEISKAVGVDGLHTSFTLKERPGGITTISKESLQPEKILFVESQLTHPRLNAHMDSFASSGGDQVTSISNDTLILHFSKQLRALQLEHKEQRQRNSTVNSACTLTSSSAEASTKADRAASSHAPNVEKKSDWDTVRDLMFGCWPRSLKEVGEEQLVRTTQVVRQHFFSSSSPATGSLAGDWKKTAVAQEAKKGEDDDEEELEELVHLALVCRYNCFQSGFFRTCALLNHSCAPTAAMKVVARTQSVHMLLVSPVAPGDELTVKYLTDADFLEGVGRRRELLFHSWLFWCECRRCKEDNEDTAQCEMRVCSKCGSYVHVPVPAAGSSCSSPSGASTSTGTNHHLLSATNAVDPLTVRERSCSQCNHTCSWNIEETKLIYSLRDEAAASMQGGSVQDLCVALLHLQDRVTSLVHPQHWIHRVLLYYFGVAVTRITAQWFHGILNQQLTVDEVAAMALKQFGVDKHGCNGGDALVCLRDLWQRMVSFYPWNEGWALHCAICRLATLNLCHSRHPAALSPEAAVAVLTTHAPFIGGQERSACHRVFVAAGGKTSSELSAKIIKQSKRVLEV